MKLKKLFLFLFVIVVANASCSQENNEDVDCLKEQILVKIEHEHHTDNNKAVDFSINYTGDKTITSINWDFGDGTSESGDSIAVTHVYKDTGVFVTKAAVNIEQNNATCTLTPQKKVRIK